MSDTTVPTWEQSIKEKHRWHIQDHEARFGKLGELQTEKQKEALRKALGHEIPKQRGKG